MRKMLEDLNAGDFYVMTGGWMHKKGGVRRTWAKRWFELRGHFLFRCEDKGGSFSGAVYLPSCEWVRPSEAPEKKPHELELLTPDRVTRLQCGSNEDLTGWLNVISPLVNRGDLLQVCSLPVPSGWLVSDFG